MLGVRGQTLRVEPDGVQPAVSAEGIRVLSMDLLLPGDYTPVVWDAPTQAEAHTWRGTMEGTALREFLADTAWGTLDVLLIDLPPGADRLPTLLDLLPGLTGAVVVRFPPVSPPGRAVMTLARERGRLLRLSGLWLRVPTCGTVGRSARAGREARPPARPAHLGESRSTRGSPRPLTAGGPVLDHGRRPQAGR
jgi:ATP-binding protein involved in chromosome partitioning